MKWWFIGFIWFILFMVVVALKDVVDHGPQRCTEACKASGRTMQSYSLTGGCACGEVRP